MILLTAIHSGSSPKIPQDRVKKKVVLWFIVSKCLLTESPELGIHLILHFGKNKGGDNLETKGKAKS